MSYDARLVVREPAASRLKVLAAGATIFLLASYIGRVSLLAGGVLGLVGLAILATARDKLVGGLTEQRVVVTDNGIDLHAEVRTRGGSHLETRTIARSEIASAFYRPGARGGDIIVLDRRGQRLLEARMPDEHAATALLEALALDAGKVRMSIDVSGASANAIGRSFTRLGAIATLLALGIVSVILGASPLALIMGIAFATTIFAWPGKVAIASDGVMLSWFHWKRFVRFADVVEVRETTKGGRLDLTSGETIALPKAIGAVDTSAMIERVREALDVHRRAASASTVANLVERGDRDPKAWIEHLRSLRTSDYRTAALRDEELWRVVENPSAAADARVGAAFLLRTGLDDAGRARIRIASEASASPKLRIALDATVSRDEEDDAIEEHLAALTVPLA